MRSARVLVAVLACLLGAAVPARAQTIGVSGELHVAFPVETRNWPYQATATDVGDIDGDGLHDIGVVARRAHRLGHLHAGDAPRRPHGR